METKTKYAIVAVVIAVVVIAAASAWALSSASGSDKVIKYKVVAPVNQAGAIANGEVSGAVGWEPYPSAALEQNGNHVLFWSSDVWPDHPCCVIVVNNNFAAAHPDVVKNFLAADIAAYNWLKDALAHPDGQNYSLLVQMGVQFANVDADAVRDSLNHTSFGYEIGSSFKEGVANYTNDFIGLNQTTMAKVNSAGYSSVDAFVNAYIDTSYLEDAKTIAPSNGPLVDVNVGYLTGDLHQILRLIADNTTVGGGKSLFNQYGINPVSANPGGYTAGPAEMLAFAAGSVDIGYLGAPPAILYKLNSNTPTTIVAAENTEGSALIVSADIKSIDDLKGKIVATPGPGSIQHLLMQAIAEENGYKLVAA